MQIIDSYSIRVHQHDANGSKKGDPVAWAVRAACPGLDPGRPDHQVHALIDANGLSIALKLTAGQAHHGRSAADRLDAGDVLLADRAYASNALRIEMAHAASGSTSSP